MIAFLPVALVVMLAPGPDFAVITRQTLVNGRRHGLVTSFGVSAGLLVHTTAAVAGLSAVLATSATLFTVVKLVGAAYLVFLGVRAIWEARRPGTEPVLAPGVEGDPGVESVEPYVVAFRQGMLTNVLNPKVAIMFLSLLPQFVDARSGLPVWVQTVELAALFIVLNQLWFLLYTAALGRAGDVVRKDHVRRWFDRVAGAVFIGLGVRVALDRA